MNSAKIVRIASFVLMAVALVMLVMVMLDGNKNAGMFIDLGYISTFVAVAAAIIFSILNLFKNGKAAKNTLVGFGVLALVLILSYVVSSGADHESYGALEISEGTSRMVSTGLTAFYIFLAITVGSIAFTEISKIFK